MTRLLQRIRSEAIRLLTPAAEDEAIRESLDVLAEHRTLARDKALILMLDKAITRIRRNEASAVDVLLEVRHALTGGER